MRKKYLTALFLLTMALSLGSCGENKDELPTNSTTEKTDSEDKSVSEKEDKKDDTDKNDVTVTPETTPTPEATPTPEVTAPPEITETPTEVAERSSMDLYMDFLAGKERAFSERREFTYYDDNKGGFMPYLNATEGMTLPEVIRQIMAVADPGYELYLTMLDYCFIDCGTDGEPELAIDAHFDTVYGDSLERQLVVKNFDGKLQICQLLDSNYGYYAALVDRAGFVRYSSTAGAGNFYYESRYLDANADSHFVYGDEESYYG